MQALPALEAEAARYALLRRLAPSFRHHLVVNLQPIGMICEVMDRRLRGPAPDLAHVQDSAGKINGFARAALNSCIDVVGWLAPDDAARTSVHDGARECGALLATSLGFRGYALRNEVTQLPGQVRRGSMRTLLTGILVHCSDALPAPADLVLAARAEDDAARITVEVRPGQAENTFPGEPPYRKLAWSDVEALARAEGVQLAREEQAFVLRLPWLDVPA